MTPADFVLRTLRTHAVRLTPTRRQVLEVLLRTSYALSSSEIEQQVSAELDRATLFRTLRLLEQKGLIHRILDYSEVVRYAAAPGLRTPEVAPLPAEHVHFKCTTCQRLYCLPRVPVPEVPDVGLHVTRRDCLLSGVCANCLLVNAPQAAAAQ